MSTLPSLDPDDKLFLGRLNDYFCDEVESVADISREDLIWYLRTLLIGYDELLGQIDLELRRRETIEGDE